MSTLAAWIVYALVVSALFGVGAWLLESALRGVGAPARWAWQGAMLLSVLVPVAVVVRPSEWEGASVVPAAGFIPLAPVAVTSGGGVFSLDAVLSAVWVLWTAVLLLWITLACARLEGARRSWRRTVVWGESVWLTRDVGPAVYGLGRCAILMPEWALSLDRRTQHFMLLHEREHIHAGDSRLAAVGLLLLVAFPWNAVLWWQFRRLRQAIEVDCDRRVLARDPDAAAYGSLLLEVGRRRAMPGLVVALAEPRSFLERRIRVITSKAKRNGKRAALLGGVAVVAAAIAVCTRDPLAPTPAAELMATDTPDVVRQDDVSRAPVFTPFTVAPRLQNTAEVAGMLERNYPPLLRDAGIGGKVVRWFFIDEDGKALRTMVYQTSGQPALDEAATRVAAIMRFSPAYNRDQKVRVWVQIPILFSAK
jgi:TonB family protein